MYPKFQRNITPTKKPLSLFQVLSAVQHYRTKFIRNANELFDLVFSWQLTFIFTQSQIYTNLSDTIKSDFIYQTLKSFILGFSNLKKISKFALSADSPPSPALPSSSDIQEDSLLKGLYNSKHPIFSNPLLLSQQSQTVF
jgi:hypothetical protein